MKKTLLPTNDLYMQFTEEELNELNMKPGDKFDVKHHNDGSIELRPYVKVELDMEEWPREVLEMIIKESCEQDISANDVINNLLKESLKNFEKESDDDFFSDSTKSSYKEVDDLKSLYGSSSYDAVLPTASNSGYTTASSDVLCSD
jgi:antitoxin component of MazEF toxin-antitoxin module